MVVRLPSLNLDSYQSNYRTRDFGSRDEKKFRDPRSRGFYSRFKISRFLFEIQNLENLIRDFESRDYFDHLETRNLEIF
jgi:hypothetical protein